MCVCVTVYVYAHIHRTVQRNLDEFGSDNVLLCTEGLNAPSPFFLSVSNTHGFSMYPITPLYSNLAWFSCCGGGGCAGVREGRRDGGRVYAGVRSGRCEGEGVQV